MDYRVYTVLLIVLLFLGLLYIAMKAHKFGSDGLALLAAFYALSVAVSGIAVFVISIRRK